jgi:hypothetical protein
MMLELVAAGNGAITAITVEELDGFEREVTGARAAIAAKASDDLARVAGVEFDAPRWL